MAKKYDIQRLPGLKALRHMAKYPHSTVIGLLVGSIEGDSVSIVDAIPLVHHWLDLSPMLEAGLALAKIHVESKNLKLLGTYVAHSRTDLKSLDIVSQKLNESLQSESSIALIIDSQKLNTTENPFIPYTRSKDNEWSTLDDNCFQANIPKDWLDCEGSIGDFDDHLEDLGVDWLVNPTILCPA
ncbi:hypothetical protein PTTG_02424 [Puccinia triticina 1-1 BBBD Race 1]|uniref:MPN domain-containing protein n=2 Tax=Puccinia triticina TaxID=208348 RepID=A0A180H1Y5_PUCT1|nr:uncharacterized protein PtA15_4A285 [Puccinia triticina]OAV99036.1 hypothetical protein PTTG_02424 [Puccinia triticina 1-1 BBBD Race 1]WAQ83836.1 hypothetical protein PtA15_4A285 [Puccinia triticina]WAR54680.1 hypothetical protein PtB15_4B297 [Puccinia triticina]